MEFNQYVEYRTAAGVFPVALEQHAIDNPYTLDAIQSGYQHAAQLGRTYQLSSDALETVRSVAAESYHQDVIDNEITSDDPAEITDRLAWVRSRPEWRVGLSVAPPDGGGDGGVYFNHADGNLYRCVHAHITQADWRPDLPGMETLWTRYYVEEWTEWVQPYGGSGTYVEGAKVTHNGSRWINIVPAPTLNVWEPGVYGWEEQV